MTVTQLRYFLEIAKEKNMTRAAEKLFVSQQALSKSIRLLESEWGVTLFQRTDAGVKLTYVGRQLQPAAENLLRQYDQNQKVISTILETSRYRITIVYEAESLLQTLPYEFFSNIGSIRITTRRVENMEQCIEEVKNGERVIALINTPVPKSSLCFQSLLRGYMSVIMPVTHPLAKKDSLRLSDLKDEPHVWITGSQNYTNYYVEECIKRGFYPRFTLEYPSPQMVLQAIAAGSGITVGPPGLVKLEKEDRVLTRKPLIEDGLLFEIGLLMKKEDAERQEIQSFINAAEAAVS